ncbi:MAG: domain S-box [Gemmatimonadetes bacterium]|nr:domain S-box [Gemmatimonadota bacterium]
MRQSFALRDNVALSRAHLAQERRFRSLVQFSSDLITVIDRTGTIVYQSPVVQRLLGLPTEATIGSSVLLLVHPEEHARFQRLVERAAHALDAAPPGDSWRPDDARLGSGRPSRWRLRHSSGRYLWAESGPPRWPPTPAAGFSSSTRATSPNG